MELFNGGGFPPMRQNSRMDGARSFWGNAIMEPLKSRRIDPWRSSACEQQDFSVTLACSREEFLRLPAFHATEVQWIEPLDWRGTTAARRYRKAD